MPNIEQMGVGEAYQAIMAKADLAGAKQNATATDQRAVEVASDSEQQKQYLAELEDKTTRKKLIGYIQGRFIKLSPEKVEELVQESYAKAIQAISKNKFRGQSTLYSWLTTIAINTVLSELKKARNKKHDSVDGKIINLTDKKANPEEAAQDAEVREYVGRLPAKQRAAMALLLQDYTYSEIANELGISEGTAKSNVFKAKAKLKTMMLDDKKAA